MNEQQTFPQEKVERAFTQEEAEQMRRQRIYREIEEEREYQNGKWGTEFDDKNTINDWGSYITRYTGEATQVDNPDEQRRQILKVAALAIAAIETFDRNQKFGRRHYD
jgi:hypothetical protein